ncbi:MAG: nuclear transport factor 2 family protein [Lysobacterales bacterium]|nr:MAG: nuclear transport factor 2 family protein [Xanthomonadales bacterium]
MTTTHDMQHAVARLIEAINSDDARIVPLADDVSYSSPLLPEPIEGESAVRAHLAGISPFISRVELKRALFDGDSAALVMEFEAVNGVVLEGVEILRIGGGRIRDFRVYFDTGPLLRGRG